MSNRFIQIHALTAYPASLLNRDDAGFAKRVPFGGQVRTRISSQCLKRHWRTHDGEDGFAQLKAPSSIRSRHTFEKLVVVPLVEAGLEESEVRKAVKVILKELKVGDSDSDKAHTGQITVFGQPEIEYFKELCRTAVTGDDPIASLIKDAKKNLAAIRHGAGLEAAMFGRMVTSDLLARCDAAVHVAHAFTVHGHQGEADYFSAVDDLPNTEDAGAGAGHIGTTELASGLFYQYVVIDVPALVSNIVGGSDATPTEEERKLAVAAVQRLMKMIATVSPGAKRGSTAPYAYAQTLLVEAGSAQPRTLANAFLKPVQSRPDVVLNAYEALGGYIEEHDRMYGRREARCFAGLRAPEAFGARIGAGSPSDLTTLAAFIGEQVGA